MKVLVVDDSELARRAVGQLLSDAGFDTDLAAGGHAALERIGPGSHDAVLLDVVMPNMDGLETLLALRRVDPSLRVVVMTSRPPAATVAGPVDYLAFARALGAHAVLRKPFGREELLHALCATLPEVA